MVAAGTSLADPAWVASLYRNGAAGSFDVVAVHPYEQPFAFPPGGSPTGFAGLAAVRNVMLRHGDRRPIWLTEFGWPVGPGTGIDEARQAEHLRAAVAYASASAARLGLGPMFWYSAADSAEEVASDLGYGLMTWELRPRPALAALAAAARSPAPIGGLQAIRPGR